MFVDGDDERGDQRQQRMRTQASAGMGAVRNSWATAPLLWWTTTSTVTDRLNAVPCCPDAAAEVLGIGRTVAYELVRTDRWPTPVRRVGRQIKIPTAYLIDLLGLTTERGSSRSADVAAVEPADDVAS